MSMYVTMYAIISAKYSGDVGGGIDLLTLGHRHKC